MRFWERGLGLGVILSRQESRLLGCWVIKGECCLVSVWYSTDARQLIFDRKSGK